MKSRILVLCLAFCVLAFCVFFGAHGAGGLLRGCRDEEDFGGWCFLREIGFWRTDDAVGDEWGLERYGE